MPDGPQIVLIEDEAPTVRWFENSVKPTLTQYGHEVLPSATLVDAVPPTAGGVAVCDVRLDAEPMGPAAVRLLRERGWTVLLISGRAPDEQLLESMAAGARGYVEKRFLPDILAEVIVILAGGGWHLSRVLADLFYKDLDRRRLPDNEELSTADRNLLRTYVHGCTDAVAASRHGLNARGLDEALTRIFTAATNRRQLIDYRLTAREIEVVRAIGCDHTASTRSAAGVLRISHHTINNHLKSILAKYCRTHPEMPQPDQTGAARLWAAELGLCPDMHSK